jgi:sortase (surface protein transpeptidase)
METPDFGTAGWYTKGPRPGEQGPAVITAHVDSYKGPDVFFRLRERSPGEEVHVYRHDGSVTRFVVEGTKQTPKEDLPANRIWNDTDEAVLRLVTCGGTFDRSRRSYRDNVIVYAKEEAAA